MKFRPHMHNHCVFKTITIICFIFLVSIQIPSSASAQQVSQEELRRQTIENFNAWRKDIPDLERRQYERIKKLNRRVLNNTRLVGVALFLQICTIVLLMILLLRSNRQRNEPPTQQAVDKTTAETPQAGRAHISRSLLRTGAIRHYFQSKVSLGKFQEIGVSTSLVLFNFFLIFIFINWSLSVVGYKSENIFDDIASASDNWKRFYSIEDLRRVYPEETDENIIKLTQYHSGTGVIYAPYIQNQTEPGLHGPSTAAAVHRDGFRLNGKNQAPWPLDDKAYNIFVFGGSTTIGVGVDDDKTIPAHLQRVLRDDILGSAGRPQINVYNFGAPGYFSVLERVFYEKVLLAGHVPDLVIFIDGYNDNHVYTGEPGMTWWIAKNFPKWLTAETEEGASWYLEQTLKKIPFSLWLEKLKEKQTLETYGTQFDGAGLGEKYLSDPLVHQQIIERYFRNKKLTEVISSNYGIKTLFVWQPVSTYKFSGVLPMGEMEGQGLGTRYGYPRMRNYVDQNGPYENFLWCADVFEGVSDNLWVDAGIHYNSRGGELIAECIANKLAGLKSSNATYRYHNGSMQVAEVPQ